MRKLCSAVFLPYVFAILACRQVGDDGSELQHQKLQNVLTFADAGEFSAAWSRENKLVVHLMSDPSFLHPAAFSTTPSVVILQLTHSRLLQTDLAEARVLPGMVKSLPSVSSD